MITEFVDKQYANGAVAMIIRDGKIVYYKAFGYNDIDAKKPMQKDAIFRIASQTKAITSVAVMNINDAIWISRYECMGYLPQKAGEYDKIYIVFF